MKLKDQLVPVIGFSLILMSAFIYNRIEENASKSAFFWIAVICILVYIILLSLYTWFYSRPLDILTRHKQDFNTLHLKIKATVDSLVQKERFIDQSILSIIEREAQYIWVITTKLANELQDIKLQQAVEDNLRQGKRYTYFLPHPGNIHFKKAEWNLEKYKTLDLYKKFKSQIEFVRLPLDTQFLLEEVVIYNPEQEEIRSSEVKGINGFTYYESTDGKGQQLHMKIEGELLNFLCERLHDYLKNTGLKFAIESVLLEYSEVLDNEDKLYLVDLLKESRISNENDYNNFIDKLSNNTLTHEYSSVIDQSLSKYKIIP